MKYIIPLALSYLAGSIPTSIWLARLWKGIDIRQHGSGNAGATNVYRVLGPAPALITAIVDMGKGWVAAYYFPRIFEMPEPYQVWFGLACGFVAMLGHIYTVFAGFKGGKGVLSGAGVLAAFDPIALLVGVVVFASMLAIFKMVSLGSLAAASSITFFLLLSNIFGRKVEMPVFFACILLTLLLFYTHRQNIKRILTGTERKIGQKDKPIA
ncbi:MAG: glycerol-3-phosphate 1-O-acyltransferase PlsY [candidate division Zixibacteria bacterium]|nr:glycerol-3-phosphate 1-O-acyltransferase PlsY [candidate division Zixibacteria bacterium]MCI0595960.1 glycerol-3-phosphate 1-O-acyltransferase PlsY [candidate division Zixibacteria bacterium]